jgi:hypothetical protein
LLCVGRKKKQVTGEEELKFFQQLKDSVVIRTFTDVDDKEPDSIDAKAKSTTLI